MGTVKVDNLAQAVEDELDQFAGLALNDIVEAQKTVAKATVKSLRATSPGRGGRYEHGWKSKTTKTRTGASTVIYQGDLPGLAHLLEFGHPIISGGRTVGQAKAFPHIAQAEKKANADLEAEITRRIESGS